MKRYFTSDWHLGDDRIGINGKPNLFFRPFSSVEEENSTIVENFKKVFQDGDELWHLGDVVYADTPESWNILAELKELYPNSKFNLIIGNYDEDKLEKLSSYFNCTADEVILTLGDKEVYLNHYPVKCKEVVENSVLVDFAITGHIHAHWKTQHNMINVGVDVTHFKPISEQEILFWWNANTKGYYDQNCYPYKPI